MFTLTLSLDSLAVYIVAADVLLLLAYVLYLLHKKRRLEKAIATITQFITDYFMNTGAEVRVSCFKLDGHKRFVTLIESQPLKRFRYSNVLENNLSSHIHKLTGNMVEKIYWRFPIQLRKEDALIEDSSITQNDDMYFSDGYALAREKGEYKVSEVSWDEFEGQKKDRS